MQITLARPWTAADGTEYGPDETVEVSDDVAWQLIHDGNARAAGAVIEGDVDPEAVVELEQRHDEEVKAAKSGPPPQTGEGSSRDAWAAYAAENDVAVTPDTPRRDIIAALKDAGIPVEPAQPDTDSSATSEHSEGVS